MFEIEETNYQEMIIHDEGKVTVILPQEAHQWARIFAAKQDDVESGRRVYLNTLAVFAVSFFLERHRIETDLEASDCWYPNPMTPFDVADLYLPDLGQIECRPVLPDQRHIEIPEDARNGRLAYVAVQFSEVLDRVVLLGVICGESRSSIYIREFSPSKPENAIANLPIFLNKVKELAAHRQEDDVLSKVEADLELSSPMELVARLQRILMLESEPSLQRSAIERTLKELARQESTIREFAESHREFAVLSDEETEDLTDEQVESTFRQMAADLWRYLQG
ncbi:DUF1822 family protein [Pseudanabaena sp. FACHB-1277]|uniref:DUF1822 family protein n=1 Tax=Pseudanabaena cinerea FACHB-1277 TaxID=2949581 RepID=A0A926UUJ6_9CYAN|nr:DUF1822 family protein [Pseudanabaena cinerea]MBD2151133.1 DUF1822 family protein [Pseudanabaena cinerea FACHB-1277]